MPDPYRSALFVVRLFAALNLLPAGALLLAAVLSVPLAVVPTLAGLPATFLLYAIIYLCSGLTMWGFSRNIARFAAKAFDADPNLFS